jgi:cellulose synthase/poly-beta-1,6-N-acetylglucosamine synthase-like glycosyltransferase
MFIIISIYFLFVLILFWSYCGYPLLLWLLSIFDEQANLLEESDFRILDDKDLPLIHIVVPCYNEKDNIKEKIENLENSDYPKSLFHVTIVDGGSTDGTVDILSKMLAGKKHWSFEKSPKKGKIQQLNHFLAIKKEAELILSTDVDAILEPGCIRSMASQIISDENLGVVGANIRPGETIPVEKVFWRDQNVLRYLENIVFSSSIVVAPCYMFRRQVIERLPDDCVADDIHIAFSAHVVGNRVAYQKNHGGVETRSPQSIREFFLHKFRKGNAYIIELLRFSYRFPYFSPMWKVVYLTKVMQLIICPWILPYWMLATLSLMLGDHVRQEIAIFGVLFLLVSIVVTSRILKSLRKKIAPEAANDEEKRLMLAGFIFNNLILLLIAITFPFYRQDSSYAKIISNSDKKDIP